MTRYARSAGAIGQSKASYSATPWAQLKPQRPKDAKKAGVGEKYKSVIKRKSRKKPAQIFNEPLTLPPPRPPKGASSAFAEGIAAEIEKLPEADVRKKKQTTKKDHGGELSSLRDSMNKIKKDLQKEGRTFSEKEEKEISVLMKKAERSEIRRKKRADERESNKVCFKCRETGHDMSSCPTMKRDRESGTGICFKCGSTEHSVHQCTAKLPPGEFPYAKCFICGENGHLSKQCPDNPRGLYPNGGCCKFCGSVEHFKSSCPELLKQQGIQDYKLHKWATKSSSADDDLLLEDEKPHAAPKAKLKVVKF